MKRNSVIILFFFLFTVTQAQIWTNVLDKDLYDSRVKLVDEFMDRFNGKEIAPNLSPNDSMLLEKNICNLFDMEMVMGQSDSVRSAIIEFAQEAVASGVKLNYSDTTWYAKAVCMGTLKSKPIEFTLFLRVEPRGRDMYKWVISKAEGEIFNLTPGGGGEKVMIGPDSHETNFMKLHDLTNTKDDYITLYAQNSYKVDPTTVFYTLIYNDILNINGVVDLEFTFKQIPNYEFTIKNFERDSSNAGWLISKLEKIPHAASETNHLVGSVVSPNETIQEYWKGVCEIINEKDSTILDSILASDFYTTGVLSPNHDIFEPEKTNKSDFIDYLKRWDIINIRLSDIKKIYTDSLEFSPDTESYCYTVNIIVENNDNTSQSFMGKEVIRIENNKIIGISNLK